MDSSVALMKCSFLQPLVIPTIVPLAYGSQYGAPIPVNAGTTYTPDVSMTLSAYSSDWADDLSIRISSLSH